MMCWIGLLSSGSKDPQIVVKPEAVMTDGGNRLH